MGQKVQGEGPETSCAGCERVKVLHSSVLWSMLILQSEARGSPTCMCVNRTLQDTPRQASGMILHEPGRISWSFLLSAKALGNGHVFGDRNEFACVERYDWK